MRCNRLETAHLGTGGRTMTDKKHVPILPCPFCGYPFPSVDLEFIDEAWKDDFVVDTFDGIEYDYDNDLYYINCPGCGAAIEKTDIASTICSWNTRSLPAAASDPLQNLPAAASDPLQKKLISIPFFSEYAAANIAGTKKSTIRDRILCEPGDVFFCKGALFEITSVRWIPDLETARSVTRNSQRYIRSQKGRERSSICTPTEKLAEITRRSS